MPPEQDSPVPQTDIKAGNQPTTEESGSGRIPEADNAEVMRHLGIPLEVQAQLAPKEEPKTEEVEAEAEKPEAEAEPVVEEKPEETEAEDTEEDEEEEEPKSEEKPDKRQKRINRLTRQKHELQKQSDAYRIMAEKAEAELEKFHAEQEKTQKPKEVVPVSEAEAEAGKQLSDAENAIAWCEANSDGGTTIQDGKEVYLEPDEVSRLKRFSEKEVLRLTPEIAIAKRDAKQVYAQQKAHWDGQARQAFPEMFERGTKAYQDAQLTLRDIPQLENHPAAYWLVGLGLLGLKTIQEMQAKQKPNGEKKTHDISPRAFEPRVPIAPHTAAPPSRNERPSSTKKYDQAMSKLSKEGGRENLVAALAAMDETQPQTGPKGRRLVET